MKKAVLLIKNYRDIPCQLTPLFSRPPLILLKFGMFVGLDEKMSHTEFQVSKSNSFLYIKVEIRHRTAA